MRRECIYEAVFLALIVCLGLSATTADFATEFSDFGCLQQAGINQVIIRAYHSYGSIDTVARESIRKANTAGMSTDTYMFPCRGKDPTTQSNELLAYLKDIQGGDGQPTGTIWIDIETNPSPNCSWSQGTPTTNCAFLRDLISQLDTAGREVGIYASHYMWTEIFGDSSFCTLFSSRPLWYAHYDHLPNFDDYAALSFGGWQKPTLKQYYGGKILCGLDLDLSFY